MRILIIDVALALASSLLEYRFNLLQINQAMQNIFSYEVTPAIHTDYQLVNIGSQI